MNILPGPIVLSNENFDAPTATLIIELTCRALNVHPVKLSHYCYEEIWTRVEQIVDPIAPLRDIQCSHGKNLFASIRALAFYHRCGMITVTCSAECSPTDQYRHQWKQQLHDKETE